MQITVEIWNKTLIFPHLHLTYNNMVQILACQCQHVPHQKGTILCPKEDLDIYQQTL